MDPVSPSTVVSKPPQSNNATLFALLALGCIGAFISGFFISDLLKQTTTTSRPAISPTPVSGHAVATPTEMPMNAVDQLRFSAGNHYFDDTVLVITTDAPHQVVIGSMVRIQENETFIHNTRVSLFDGTTWERKTLSKSADTPEILPNDLVTDWSIRIDATRMLKEQLKGTITVGDNTATFQANQLQNELGIRSLPGYTKFMSEGNGTLSINGTSHPAKVLYTRIYSMNTDDIQFYTEPIGVTTDWIAFWDSLGNFYHIDSSTVSKPTPIYKTHTLGILKTAMGAVTKTFSVHTIRDNNTPPDAYTITLQSPLDVTLQLSRKSALNKAPNGSYDWYLGTVEGTLTTASQKGATGYGVIEYIHD